MIISSSVVEVDKLTWYEFDFLTPFEIPESGCCVAIEPVLPSTMKKSTIKELNVLLGGVKAKGIHSVVLNDYSFGYKSGVEENKLSVAFQLKGFN
jgi:hypothetical protein